MTTPRARLARSAPLRTATRLTALAFVGALMLVASPALADVPAGWPDPEPVGLLEGLVVYLFLPAGLFVLIAVLTVTPSLIRRQRSGADSPGEDHWFGGRREGPDELEAGSGERTSGGASGTW